MKSWIIALILAAVSVSGDTDPIFLNENWQSGYMPLEEKGASIFYWLIRARNGDAAAPLVLWLQGGPGCSGVQNVLAENGPYRVAESVTLESNPFSWNNRADVLYVDQPLGVGFSNCSDVDKIPSTDLEAAKDMYAFLGGFVTKYPEYQKRNFYITGHSYAGHYVPVTAKYFLDQHPSFLVLKGIAVGNGWFESAPQLMVAPDFGIKRGIVTDTLHYVGASLAYYMSAMMIGFRKYGVASLFNSIADRIGNGIKSRFNVYDIRKKCDVPPICYNNTLVDKFIERSDVLEALGVYPRKWTTCSWQVFKKFLRGSYYEDTTEQVKALLDSYGKLKVVIYTGTDDWICNIDGVDMVFDALEWSGRQQFTEAIWHNWYIGGRLAGTYRETKNLKYYKVFASGHLVCFDQPESAYEILTDLLS